MINRDTLPLCLSSPEQLGMKHLTRISPSTSAFIRTPCSTNQGPAALRSTRKFGHFENIQSCRSKLLTLEPMTTDNLSITSTNISLLPPWKNTQMWKLFGLFQEVHHPIVEHFIMFFYSPQINSNTTENFTNQHVQKPHTAELSCLFYS